ncbi:MAG: HEAT repeat domain-containing protein [Candidatus Heimdallarchaeota archaeon]|nr:HEAT repeat domain-containing protein [Candidatus Heimdallarchaeota archaeon]
MVDKLYLSDLILLASSDDKQVRQKAIQDMAALDMQYPEIMAKLEDLARDSDREVKKEAVRAVLVLSTKPDAQIDSSDDSALDDLDAMLGEFDDLGDSSLDEGEFDLESSLSEEEEDRLEASAEGEGITLQLSENLDIMVTDSSELKSLKSKGELKLTNTSRNSIFYDVDLNLSGVENTTGLDEIYHFPALMPANNNEIKINYQLTSTKSDIKLEQLFISENGSNVQFKCGEDIRFSLIIRLSNYSDTPIFSIRGDKIVNPDVRILSITHSGLELFRTGNRLEFQCERLEAGESVEINIDAIVNIPSGTPAFYVNNLSCSFKQDTLGSGLQLQTLDACAPISLGVRRKQREEEPMMFDCEISLMNQSVIQDINKIEVYSKNLGSGELILNVMGEYFSVDEREIVPTETMVFEFVFESEQTPKLGYTVSTSPQHELIMKTEYKITNQIHPINIQ